MKVLFFVRRFYPYIGGVETHTLEVTKRLVELGHEVTVVTEEVKIKGEQSYHSDVVSAKRVETHLGIKIYRIPVGNDEAKKKQWIWKWLFKHRNLVREADIIHC